MSPFEDWRECTNCDRVYNIHDESSFPTSGIYPYGYNGERDEHGNEIPWTRTETPSPYCSIECVVEFTGLTIASIKQVKWYVPNSPDTNPEHRSWQFITLRSGNSPRPFSEGQFTINCNHRPGLCADFVLVLLLFYPYVAGR